MLYVPASELAFDVENVRGAGFVVLALMGEWGGAAWSGREEGLGGSSSREKSRLSRKRRAS
jgi:hypothetical protein